MRSKVGLITILAIAASLFSASEAVAGGDYFFTKNYNDEVVRQNFDGTGSPLSIGEFGQGANLNIFGDYIYATYQGIKRMKLDGSDSSTLSSTQDIFSLASDGTYFYYGFETTQKIGRMKIDGSQVDDNWVDLSSIWNLYAGDIFIKDGLLYFGGGNNSNGMQIASVPLAGGTPTLIASTGSPIGGLTTDGNYIYWSEMWGDGLGRMRFDGSDLDDNFVTTLGNDVWSLEYANGYLYALTRTHIARISSDGQSVEETWRVSYGNRGLAIGGVRTNPVQFNLPATITKGITASLYASFAYSGRATFFAGSKRIAGCINMPTLTSSPYSVTCKFKPTIRGNLLLSVKLQPTDTQKNVTTSTANYLVSSRKTKR